LSLDRRSGTRLKVIEADGLHVDFEAKRLLGFRQHRLAQYLIASRNEVIPLQPVNGGSLRISGRFAGCQNASYAAGLGSERANARRLQKLPASNTSHFCFLPD
jgi:hypothetical protein